MAKNQFIGWRTVVSTELSYCCFCNVWVSDQPLFLNYQNLFINDPDKKERKSAEAKYADIAGKPRPHSAKSSFSRN